MTRSPDHIGAWLNYCDMQEGQAFGAWLREVIAAHVCGDSAAPESEIARCVYRDTDCGAWVRFDEDGILVGSIVEGSDAEFSERVHVDDLMELDEADGAVLLVQRWDAALDVIEGLVAEAWAEMQEET